MKKGFTFLEILIALGVFFVLATIIATALSNFRKNALLQEAKTRILAELNLARAQTLGSEDNSRWGVHFEASKIVRFKGGSYLASSPQNQPYELPPGTQISLVSLSGGAADVIFERLTGRASATGAVQVSLLSDAAASSTITISNSGVSE